MTNKSPSPTTNATPEEKLATLFNDKSVLRQKDTGTFLSQTHTDEGGRFAKPQHVVGATPAPEYPRQPSGSWSNQTSAIPPEEPLGFSVDETPIVGEVAEVQASIDRLEAAAPAEVSVPHSPDAAGGTEPTETGNDPSAPSQELAVSPNQSPTIEPETDPVALGMHNRRRL